MLKLWNRGSASLITLYLSLSFSMSPLLRWSSFEGGPQTPIPVSVLLFLFLVLLLFVVILLIFHLLHLQPQDGSSSHQPHQEEAERGPGGQRHGWQRACGKDEPTVCRTAVSIQRNTHLLLHGGKRHVHTFLIKSIMMKTLKLSNFLDAHFLRC